MDLASAYNPPDRNYVESQNRLKLTHLLLCILISPAELLTADYDDYLLPTTWDSASAGIMTTGIVPELRTLGDLVDAQRVATSSGYQGSQMTALDSWVLMNGSDPLVALLLAIAAHM